MPSCPRWQVLRPGGARASPSGGGHVDGNCSAAGYAAVVRLGQLSSVQRTGVSGAPVPGQGADGGTIGTKW